MLCGLDPSFKRTGISIYTGDTIVITSYKVDLEKEKTFQNVWKEACEIATKVTEKISEYRVSQVISEVPPPRGEYSPGLWCLDSLIMDRLFRASIDKIYTIGPQYIGHVHGKRGYSKTESVELAKNIISRLNLKVEVGRINHDEAESFILLCRLFVINNMYVESVS